MTIGSWNPNDSGNSSDAIDTAFIDHCLVIAQTDAINAIEQALSKSEKSMQHVMQASQSTWFSALETYNDAQLIDLIRFFTLIEMQLSNWVGGNQSPVISINNLLKKRGVKLDKSLLLWIRANSSNRYIPNGAAL